MGGGSGFVAAMLMKPEKSVMKKAATETTPRKINNFTLRIKTPLQLPTEAPTERSQSERFPSVLRPCSVQRFTQGTEKNVTSSAFP
jgi:hypothetical protein